MISIRSRTAAMMGAGSRYPASAGSGAFSRVVTVDWHVLGGVEGGTARSGAHILVGIFGLIKSYPVRLSLAVRELGSITMW